MHSTRRWQDRGRAGQAAHCRIWLFQIKAAPPRRPPLRVSSLRCGPLRGGELGVTEQPVWWALADEVESGVGAGAFGGF